MSPLQDSHIVVVGATDAAYAAARELGADGCHVRHAATARAASLLLSQPPIDAVVLHALSSAVPAVDTLRGLRADRLEHPVVDCEVPVMVAETAGDLDQLRAFEAGADDALPHGLAHLVLRARLGALLRRSRLSTPAREIERVAGLTIDAATHDVQVRGTSISLAPTAFRLLSYLAREPRRLHSNQQLLEAIWDIRWPTRTRVVSTCATRLRRSLNDAGATGLIVARRGCGYALLPPAA